MPFIRKFTIPSIPFAAFFGFVWDQFTVPGLFNNFLNFAAVFSTFKQHSVLDQILSILSVKSFLFFKLIISYSFLDNFFSDFSFNKFLSLERKNLTDFSISSMQKISLLYTGWRFAFGFLYAVFISVFFLIFSNYRDYYERNNSNWYSSNNNFFFSHNSNFKSR